MKTLMVLLMIMSTGLCMAGELDYSNLTQDVKEYEKLNPRYKILQGQIYEAERKIDKNKKKIEAYQKITYSNEDSNNYDISKKDRKELADFRRWGRSGIYKGEFETEKEFQIRKKKVPKERLQELKNKHLKIINDGQRGISVQETAIKKIKLQHVFQQVKAILANYSPKSNRIKLMTTDLDLNFFNMETMSFSMSLNMSSHYIRSISNGNKKIQEQWDRWGKSFKYAPLKLENRDKAKAFKELFENGKVAILVNGIKRANGFKKSVVLKEGFSRDVGVDIGQSTISTIESMIRGNGRIMTERKSEYVSAVTGPGITIMYRVIFDNDNLNFEIISLD